MILSKLLKQVNIMIKVSAYINTKKPIVYIFTNKEQSQNKIKETIQFIITSKV